MRYTEAYFHEKYGAFERSLEQWNPLQRHYGCRETTSEVVRDIGNAELHLCRYEKEIPIWEERTQRMLGSLNEGDLFNANVDHMVKRIVAFKIEVADCYHMTSLRTSQADNGPPDVVEIYKELMGRHQRCLNRIADLEARARELLAVQARVEAQREDAYIERRRIARSRMRADAPRSEQWIEAEVLQASVREGWLYVMTSAALPDKVKIGFTGRTPEHRAEELTAELALASPLVVVYARQTDNPFAYEQMLFDRLEGKRARQGEFFILDPEEAIEALNLLLDEAPLSAGVPWAPEKSKTAKGGPKNGSFDF